MTCLIIWLARGYFTGGHFHLTYGNPFSASNDTPRIYFQPLTLVLALLLRVTALSPGAVFMMVGAVAAVLCVMVGLLTYRQIVGLKDRVDWLGLVLFIWGGGLLVVASIAYSIMWKRPLKPFRLDPFNGWWFLNFGRNLVYPTEAFYHFLFLGSVFSAVKKNYALSAVAAFLVSLSHPFTGVELLCILCAWSFLELVIGHKGQLPWGFFLITCGLLLVHLSYYWFFLRQFAEHRSVVTQWMLPWILHYFNIIPAYALVAVFALWRVRTIALAKQFFAVRHNRLLLVWFVVAFLLAKHDLFIHAVQPLHFTRGYIWMPLFLIGAPTLIALLRVLCAPPARLVRVVAAILLVALFLTDNASWLGSFLRSSDQGIRMTCDQAAVISWMGQLPREKFLVIAQEPSIGYMTTVYTQFRAWRSHIYNTPYSLLRQSELDSFYRDHFFLPAWKGQRLLVVVDVADTPLNDQWMTQAGGKLVFNNKSFEIFEVRP